MIQQKIQDDLKEFLKAGKSFEAGVLRLMIAAFKNKEIENKGKGKEPILSEEEIIEILSRENKKRKEASEIYLKNNRVDLAQKESQEIEVIKKYLPEQLAEKEVEKIIKVAIEKIGANNVKDFGKVMAEAMKELKGKADALLISEIIKKNLI